MADSSGADELVPLFIKLSRDIAQRLDVMAQQTGLTRAELAAQLVTRHIGEFEPGDEGLIRIVLAALTKEATEAMRPWIPIGEAKMRLGVS